MRCFVDVANTWSGLGAAELWQVPQRGSGKSRCHGCVGIARGTLLTSQTSCVMEPLPLFVPQRLPSSPPIPGRDARRPENVPGIWPGLRDGPPRLGFTHEPSHPREGLWLFGSQQVFIAVWLSQSVLLQRKYSAIPTHLFTLGEAADRDVAPLCAPARPNSLFNQLHDLPGHVLTCQLHPWFLPPRVVPTASPHPAPCFCSTGITDGNG